MVDSTGLCSFTIRDLFGELSPSSLPMYVQLILHVLSSGMCASRQSNHNPQQSDGTWHYCFVLILPGEILQLKTLSGRMAALLQVSNSQLRTKVSVNQKQKKALFQLLCIQLLSNILLTWTNTFLFKFKLVRITFVLL